MGCDSIPIKTYIQICYYYLDHRGVSKDVECGVVVVVRLRLRHDTICPCVCIVLIDMYAFEHKVTKTYDRTIQSCMHNVNQALVAFLGGYQHAYHHHIMIILTTMITREYI